MKHVHNSTFISIIILKSTENCNISHIFNSTKTLPITNRKINFNNDTILRE